MVKDVITDPGRQWNEQMLQQLFAPNTIENVLKIHPASAGTPDDYIWTGKKKSWTLSVKDFYTISRRAKFGMGNEIF